MLKVGSSNASMGVGVEGSDKGAWRVRRANFLKDHVSFDPWFLDDEKMLNVWER